MASALQAISDKSAKQAQDLQTQVTELQMLASDYQKQAQALQAQVTTLQAIAEGLRQISLDGADEPEK